ncbi:hypothetical protein Nepgr_008373 [Nepenthes gracilis]|uniref:Uncharacterized protein n=1 Tax=Nepenthes gracilis TaxID=150966 RepID=A0AAD3S8U4_NEPGR|nr:hypothetical protein Nepgr_008373 [Nepenthes gracilis]
MRTRKAGTPKSATPSKNTSPDKKLVTKTPAPPEAAITAESIPETSYPESSVKPQPAKTCELETTPTPVSFTNANLDDADMWQLFPYERALDMLLLSQYMENFADVVEMNVDSASNVRTRDHQNFSCPFCRICSWSQSGPIGFPRIESFQRIRKFPSCLCNVSR